MGSALDNILKQFDPISLKDMSDYKLLNRIDTKYVCNIKQLGNLLLKANEDFRIQASKSKRIFKYESLYFDTPDLKTYFDHHRGKRLRYKVRFRKYLNSGDTFLEIKNKRDGVRTDKKRVLCELSSCIEKHHEEFLKNHIELPISGLNPTIWTIFKRITLAGSKHIERVTIDSDISFKNETQSLHLPGLVIIEVKRNKTLGLSPFSQILRNEMIRPSGISKYVMGNIFLKPQLKHNSFSDKIKNVKKICYGS